MAVIEEIIEEKVVATVPEIPPVKVEKEETDVPEPDEDGDVFYDCVDYQAEELEKLIKEATEYKSKGNTYFVQKEYKLAIQEYENALMTCPESKYKERATYFGNIAACHLKLEEYKDCRDICTSALKLDQNYTKAYFRRAQANEKIGSSTSMSEALKDYKKLKEFTTIDQYTRRECQRAERELPTKIKDKMEKEKEEMIGKLKDLGNSFLSKFGMSTDNFQLQPDPSGSGGYSMNFVNSPAPTK